MSFPSVTIADPVLKTKQGICCLLSWHDMWSGGEPAVWMGEPSTEDWGFERGRSPQGRAPNLPPQCPPGQQWAWALSVVLAQLRLSGHRVMPLGAPARPSCAQHGLRAGNLPDSNSVVRHHRQLSRWGRVPAVTAPPGDSLLGCSHVLPSCLFSVNLYLVEVLSYSDFLPCKSFLTLLRTLCKHHFHGFKTACDLVTR